MSAYELLDSRPQQAWWGLPLIRLIVGAVFLSEGLQKFIYPDDLGPGRFEKIGFANPEFCGNFVGVVEVVCGAMLLVGLLTRLAALPLVINMLVAIMTTKIPILLGRDLGPFQVRDLDTYGFWSMAHEIRTDWAMLLGSVFLLIAGGGPWAVDRLLARRRGAAAPAHAAPAATDRPPTSVTS